MNNVEVRCVETGRIFPSIKKAGDWVSSGKWGYSSITQALSGLQAKAHGYRWSYVDPMYVERMSLHRRSNSWLYKQVRCVETGQVFERVADGEIWAGSKSKKPGTNLTHALKHQGGKYLGYSWEYTNETPVREYFPPNITDFLTRNVTEGRSRRGSDHLRKWVVLSKEKNGKVVCSIEGKSYPTILIDCAHIRPFKECADHDKYHRDSCLPISMWMHKLYDYGWFKIQKNGTIKVLKEGWKPLDKLDGEAIHGWRKENARFTV